MDLNYGWDKAVYLLNNVEISKRIELMELNASGDWVQREPDTLMDFMFSEKALEEKNLEYESVNKTKYSISLRTLQARVSLYTTGTTDHSKLLLGVPEDKKVSFTRQEEGDHFYITIREADTVEDTHLLNKGQIAYADYHHTVLAVFHVPPSVFDEIERISASHQTNIKIVIYKKGWFAVGNAGESYIYLDYENTEMAELGEVIISKELTTTLKDSKFSLVDGYSETELASNTHIHEKLSDINVVLKSILFIAFITALTIFSYLNFG